MRGSPLLRALLAFFAILALGWPLRELTGATDAPRTQPKIEAAAEEQEISLKLDFTALPRAVKVLHLGKEVWDETTPPASMERTLQLAYPEAGIDLQLQIEWPADAPLAAVRVTFTDPTGETHEKSLWGQGSVDDVVTFP